MIACDVESLRKRVQETANTAAQKKPVEIVIPVEAALPHRGDISAYFETFTRVEAEKKPEVLAEAVGQCIEILAEVGDTVERGQVLAELDKREAQAAYGQMEVQVRQNQAAYERAKAAYEQGIGAKVEMDNAKFAWDQSLQNLESQRLQLENLTIRAPISGVVTARQVQRGQLVSSGAPIFVIVDPASYALKINVPEKELARLHLNQIASVTIDAIEGRLFTARVRRINPAVDSTTGTVQVVLDFDDENRELLRDSAFARVKLVVETHENTLLIPKNAVVEENARQYVYVVREKNRDDAPAQADVPPVEEGAAPAQSGEVLASPRDEADEPAGPVLVAERVEVKTGLEDHQNVEIVDGLVDSDLIVVLGQHTLKPGSIVRVTNATDEIMAQAGLSAAEALKRAQEKGEGPQPGRAGPPVHVVVP